MFGISVIIPCKNEEKYISRCIESLLRQKDSFLDMEIVVVDNGSTDGTLRILEGFASDIDVHVCPGLNIAGLRNLGVEKSAKDWIAFIDGDVEVDPLWGRNLVEFIEGSSEKGMVVTRIITGSTCLPPENPSRIERIWYEQLLLRDASATRYINSGNLILHREMMNRLGGFDTSFETGEEENLCEVARRDHDAMIVKNSDIRAIHHGYPKDIQGFFRRMRWHGAGMSRYLLRPWESKPLMLAAYYILLTIIHLVLLFMFNSYILLTFTFITFQIAPAFLYAARRYKGRLVQTSILTFLYVCFGWARAVSLFDMILGKNVTSKHKETRTHQPS